MLTPHISKRARIEINGVNPYIHVSAQEAETLKKGWRRPIPVCVQVNGQPKTPWRINMVPMGTGDFYLYLHNDVRRPAGVKVGDIVDVQVWFDESYQSGPHDHMPDWFSKELAANKVAKKAWDVLSPSRQKEVARYFQGLKSDSAKERNFEILVKALSGEPVHFLGRDWRDGK